MRRFFQFGMLLLAMVAASAYFNSTPQSAQAKDQSEFIRYTFRYSPAMLVAAEPKESNDKLPPLPSVPLKEEQETKKEPVKDVNEEIKEEVTVETKPKTQTYSVRRGGFLSRLFRR